MLHIMSLTGLYNKDKLQGLMALSPEVDYQALMAQMPEQSHPRRKLKELQNKGFLIRVKKGFYVLTSEFIGRLYSEQIVANLLYGPSYLSLEYALSYYQLIPERVVELTSVTTQKNKIFSTPIGRFSYLHLSTLIYPLGITMSHLPDGRTFLMATPEKALMDIFTLKFKNSEKPKPEDILAALTQDMRVDLLELKKILNKDLLIEMKPHYKNRRWNYLLIEKLLEML
ncbi:MAG: hypothetical protein ABL930_06135 [Pseudobdellovibrio sp.]